MQKFLAAFTYIFNPLLVPAYATLFYFLVTRNFFYRHEIYLVFIQVLILTLLLPISIFYLLKSLGLIKTKMLLDKKERRLPLAFYCILLLILVKYSLSIFVIPELYYYFLGSLISAALALMLILFNHRSSLHVLGVASLTMFIISISAYYHIQLLSLIAFFILCTGMVASARLQAKAHTLAEVTLGALLGILPQVALWFVWLVPSL
jgi:hypothetical protein